MRNDIPLDNSPSFFRSQMRMPSAQSLLRKLLAEARCDAERRRGDTP